MRTGDGLDPGRGRLALAWRRAQLGVLLLWRRRWPPAAEITARDERTAERRRAREERRLAAEEYHWTLAGGQRGEDATPAAAPTRGPAAPDRPGA